MIIYEVLKSIKEKVKNLKGNVQTERKDLKGESEDESSMSSSSEDNIRSVSKNEEKAQIKEREDIGNNIIVENDELFSENKKEINNLRKEILKIKKRKEDPDEEIRLKEELKLYTPLQKYREKYLTKKKQRISGRETTEKLQQFREKLKSTEGDEDNWMNNRLKFHVDSQRAYAINENIAKHNTISDVDAIEIIDPKKRFQRSNENENITNPEILNIDKIFNVDDLINKTQKN